MSKLSTVAASAALVTSMAFAPVALSAMRWVPKESTERQIVAGRENGHDLYMCRVTYTAGGQTHVLPGKTWSGHNKCNVGAFHEEKLFDQFERLVGDQFKWVASNNVGYPANAVIAGRAGDGRHLLACAAVYNESVHPGYMNSDTNCNFGYGGEEKAEDTYFVLTTENPSVSHEDRAQPSQHSTSVLSWVGLGAVAAFCFATGGTCVATIPF